MTKPAEKLRTLDELRGSAVGLVGTHIAEKLRHRRDIDNAREGALIGTRAALTAGRSDRCAAL